MADTVWIGGRTRVPLSKKLNPLWWFQNDTEQTMEQAGWLVGKPYWWRVVTWQVRNPLQNFRAFVIGVQDKNYWVTARRPVLTVQRNDLEPPETGWQWALLHGGDLWLPRFFLSYSWASGALYLGWQPTGFAGAKFDP